MKRTLIIGCLAALAVTACQKEGFEFGDGTVRFAAYQDGMTKVTGTNFDAGDEIAVFAPVAGSTIDGQYDTLVANKAVDCRYVADNFNNFTAKTEGDKIRYSTASTLLDFYAVYPAVGPAPKYAVTDRTTFKIDLGDISDQRLKGAVIPYIYSNNATSRKASDGVVMLRFKNIFSKIGVDVDYDPVILGDTLSRVEFYADGGLYRECVIDLKNVDYATVATNGGRNMLATLQSPYHFAAPTKDATYTEGYIIPGTALNPVIRLTFGEVQPKVYTCRIPTTDSKVVYQAGMAYTYQVTLGETAEVGIGGTIEEWVAAGDVPTIEAH